MKNLKKTEGMKRHLLSAAFTFFSNFLPLFFTSLAALPVEQWTASVLYSVVLSSAVTALRAIFKVTHEKKNKEEF